MKLYELKDGEQHIRILPQTGDPATYPGTPEVVAEGDVVVFHSIESRAALCKTLEGEPVTLISWCEVELFDAAQHPVAD